jgi:hypothetical protein
MKGIAPIVLVLIALGVITVTTGTTIAIAHSKFPADSPLWGIHVATKRLMCNFQFNSTAKMECHQELTKEIKEGIITCQAIGCPQEIMERIQKQLEEQERIERQIRR